MGSDNSSWQGTLCIEVSPVPNTIIIFGASGDLAQRKLIPALFSLSRRNLFHPKSRIIGCSRSPMDDNSFRDAQRNALKERFPSCEPGEIDAFLGKIFYIAGGYDSQDTYRGILRKLLELEREQDPAPNRTFYLATPAALYPIIVPMLAEFQLTAENYEGIP